MNVFAVLPGCRHHIASGVKMALAEDAFLFWRENFPSEFEFGTDTRHHAKIKFKLYIHTQQIIIDDKRVFKDGTLIVSLFHPFVHPISQATFFLATIAYSSNPKPCYYITII